MHASGQAQWHCFPLRDRTDSTEDPQLALSFAVAIGLAFQSLCLLGADIVAGAATTTFPKIVNEGLTIGGRVRRSDAGDFRYNRHECFPLHRSPGLWSPKPGQNNTRKSR